MPFRIGPWEVALFLLLLLPLIIVMLIVIRMQMKSKRAPKFRKNGDVTGTYFKDAMIIECPACGTQNSIVQPPQSSQKYRCGKCGTEITFLEAIDTNSEALDSSVINETNVPILENTSGQGKLTVVPQEIKGWNWGAFLLGLIWGAGNNVWWSLLILIPYFDIVWIFVMGVKGSEWAWKSKRWYSIEHFKRTQKKWRDWGIGITVIFALIVFIIALF